MSSDEEIAIAVERALERAKRLTFDAKRLKDAARLVQETRYSSGTTARLFALLEETK